MKLLKDILYTAPILDAIGSTNVAVENIAFDSRKVVKESLFVAVPGTVVDGHDYIAQAISQGARSIVCEKLPEELNDGTTYIQVKDAHATLGILASNFYGNPSSKLKLVGITGTNGKTTVATLCHRLFMALGQKAGLLSTVNVMIGREIHPATHTTPDPVSLNSYLKKMVDAGCKYCFMEASSHGIEQRRIAGLKFIGAAFTNISHDHLDYHKTFDDYILAKKALFDALSPEAFALMNQDDKHGRTMLLHSKAKKYGFALKTDTDFKARIIEHQLDGMLLQLDGQEVWTKLIGTFNALNIAAVYGIAVLLGEDKLQVITAISALQSVEGRFQHFQSEGGVTAIVDYAHTPDALKNVLETIGKIRTGAETVITVVGCGGNRDKTKRPEMANIATQLSDQVIFTSDNPRNEDPEVIIQEMEAGVEMQLKRKYLSISNRKEAIRTAARLANKNDIILIAGKGHEKYQEIKGEKLPFDDMAVVRESLTQNQN
ncbi:UDP-N-acetylmuramoyl-L-alanyl-D-glutamate--2,6-diaminopimelate ligase [Owenweeksia hongkongensis]|uniref:UDP-N-acetylmuramoyl-L-alanyl-D-glutamate--2,6-diaminopimelate ligase n=1 Tax=Owenweeksia hongkongensis (strain DSM 17368 / CIP 108786 / JCM 12287 / NRRL B-23963 / UST20020801) TaxID=926562 RepID=G8R0R1_OWEHD|nr:UDP-N-acetylmuramoyl-L-alanyl-D-glutamate--2,6-diaminopimelate ligase [Owenweeksia hongkongensis]AEV33788.1 UDP-N-acetylmuramyl-tripeptide synthetase [Owenweeksia hongkongensis DSM 17368]